MLDELNWYLVLAAITLQAYTKVSTSQAQRFGTIAEQYARGILPPLLQLHRLTIYIALCGMLSLPSGHPQLPLLHPPCISYRAKISFAKPTTLGKLSGPAYEALLMPEAPETKLGVLNTGNKTST